MSGALPTAPALRGAPACGCCDGAGVETPAEVWNRAGLPEVAYRVGTHGSFKASLLSRLSAAAYPSLHGLTSRDDSDPTIALLDATAAMADVLTFYAERIANEGYLRTATEWRSLAAMGRLMGYEPSPGVAATAFLAFTLEDAAGAPEQTTVPAGTAVQSVPAANALPQTFETLADFTGRPEWNAMAALATQPHPPPAADTATVLAAGLATGVRQGDRLVLSGASGTEGGPWVRIVTRVTADAPSRTTRIDLQAPPTPWPPPAPPRPTVPAVFDLVTRRLDGGALAQAMFAGTGGGTVARRWDGADLTAYLRSKRWSRRDLMAGVMHLAAQPPPVPAVAVPPGVFRFRQKAAVFGHNAPAWNSLPVTLRQAGPVPQLATVSGTATGPGQVFGTVSNVTLANASVAGAPLAGQVGLPVTGALLGGVVLNGVVVPNAAPPAPHPLDWDATATTLDTAWKQNAPVTDGNGVPATGNTAVQLDHPVSGIAPGSLAVLEDGFTQGAFTVRGAGDRSAVAFTMSAKVTELDMAPAGGVGLGSFTRRGTAVFCDSEALALAPLPLTEPVGGSTVTLDRIYLGLAAGQPVAVSGSRADLPGVAAAEIATIAAVTVAGNTTVLTLAADLANAYDVATVRVCANVVAATHGATVAAEAVGSGDATAAFQSFTLRQPGLTVVADPSSGGTRTTLRVRVNGEAWTEVPSLYGAGPGDRVYATWLDETGHTRVVFGDGVSGARLPTGAANVVASYRAGTGSAGLVGAGAVSLPLVRPLGVRGVSNPVATADAADPDTPDMLRQAAPLHVLTLDRVVSLTDYRDFALAYPGITKAVATWQVGRRGRTVLLTVAGADGSAVRTDGPLARSLVAALRAAGDPRVPVALGPFAPVFFRVAAELTVDPALQRTAVLAAVQDALQAAFAPERRSIGQPVWQSEVVAAIQSVPGVLACQPTLLYRLDGVMQPGVQPVLTAAVPPATGTAELLLLDPRPIEFGGFA